MDATKAGYGYLVPMPRSGDSQLGNVVYIDEGGVVRSWGALTDDSYFKELLAETTPETGITTKVETYSGRAAAFTSGCLEVHALTKEDLAAGRLITVNALSRQATTAENACGWRFTQIAGKRGLGDAIVLGPHLRKSQLSLDRKLVEQWVEGAPSRSSLLSRKLVRRLPKLLVVLEEWVAPAWTHIYTDGKHRDPGGFAIGLAELRSFPQWHFIQVPGQDTLTSPYQIGNGAKSDWIVAINGITVDPNPMRFRSFYRRLKEKTTQSLSKLPLPGNIPGTPSEVTPNSTIWFRGIYQNLKSRTSKAVSKIPAPVSRVFSRFHMPQKVVSAMPKFKRKAPKRRREDLGKVVSFVVQELLDPLKTGNADDVETEVDGIAEIGAATGAEGGAITKNGDGNETAGKGIEQIESLEGTGLSSEREEATDLKA